MALNTDHFDYGMHLPHTAQYLSDEPCCHLLLTLILSNCY